MWHRLWRCPATEDLRKDKNMAEVTRRAVQAGPRSAIYSTGLVPNPEAALPGPASQDLEEQLRGESPWQAKQGELFMDGSATTVVLEGCNRAAWAVVQIKAGQEAPHRTIKGTVPDWYPQTTQAAETMALWAATTLQPEGGGPGSPAKKANV